MMNKILTVCCLSAIFFSCSQTGFRHKVRKAVIMQLNVYPESTLQDMYKNFFQDKFGPGHIVSDTAAARAYLREELAEFEVSANPDIEPIGWENNYVRVNLSLLKKGIIPEQVFFDAFMESTSRAQMPEIETWRHEWARILKIIEQMKPELAGLEGDKARIDSLLASGKYAVHHSRAFGAAYAPHYRIISTEVFDAKLRRYLK